MNLPDEFQFSASCLQDYVDCPRRFALRHVLGLAWPALVSEPAERAEQFSRQGSAFHRLVQQHLNGIPAERLEAFAGGIDLSRWWQNYQQADPAAGYHGRRMVEFPLSAPFCGRRLVAKYDLLIAGQDGQLTIVDWKTSLKRPSRENLLVRVQTRVYRYLLTLAGGGLIGREAVSPEAVRMVYWFAEVPENPEIFPYTAAERDQDRDILERLAGEIQCLHSLEDALPANREGFCRSCTYSSYCERGGAPVPWEETAAEDTQAGAELDFASIEEVAY
ncbi:MAG TPA: PD-(D/E)XK nuclease family protein [Anaerolineaceae bacterium]